MEEVDKTIIAICKRIQKKLDGDRSMEELEFLPEITKALAALITARANLLHESYDLL